MSGREVRDAAKPAVRARRRIMVVEDDSGIRALLGSALRLSGYQVLGVATGQQALTGLGQFRPDLLIVDVMLPDLDGYELTRLLRTAGVSTPVLFLTARADPGDRVAGLSAGGDDYVTKPFHVEELLLRIRAILNRLHPHEAVEFGEDDGVLSYADLRVDEDARDVRRSGYRIWLTPTEFKLLIFLLTHADQVVTRQQVLDQVWSYDFAGDGRIVDTYVRYLRRKIDSFDPPLIHTIRGVGYCLRRPPSDQAAAAL